MTTRIPSPVVPEARPLVEPTIQPLYDSEVWSPTTTEATFFSSALGSQTQAGAAGANVTKTYRHTNLETQGQLSHPKLFVVQGVRLAINNAPQTTSSDAGYTDTSRYTYGHPQGALQKFIQFLCYFALRIGVKDYARGPGYLFPANLSLVPQVASAAVGTRFAAATPSGAIVDSFYSQPWGLYFATGRNAITIPPGQHIRGTLTAAAGSLFAQQNTAFPSGTNTGIHRLVYCVLDGTFAREVQ